MRKNRGFTLIELLVVIAIISLLLSVMIPSLILVKEKAKSILCKANLKNYGLIMKMYLNDNNSEYPESQYSLVDGRGNGALPDIVTLNPCLWHDPRISPEANPGYAGVLWPYLETMKSCLCLTFGKFAKYSGHTTCITPFEPQYSYSQNYFLGSSAGVMKESQVVNPNGILIFVEETIWKISTPAPYTALANYILNDTSLVARHPMDFAFPGDTIATYHETSTAKPDEGKGNGVFVDGHVELSDPWDTEIISGMEYRSSFLLSFPKKGAKGPIQPY